jgi:DnaJ-class molecular chaperone
MDAWQKCPVCNGDGTKAISMYGSVTCNVCNGHGIISIITGLPPVGTKVTISNGNVTVSNHTGPTTGTNITYRTDIPSTPTNGKS